MAQTVVPTFRPDSAHLGVALEVMPGRVLKIDPYERMWLHENKNVSIGVALNYRTRPEDADSFAADYNYPTFQRAFDAGIRIPLERLITHKFTLEDYNQAFDVLSIKQGGSYDALKVVLESHA